jgi:hypothetical protein
MMQTCVSKKKTFKIFNSCKIQLVQWWWINSYSHNTMITTTMVGSCLGHYMITWLHSLKWESVDQITCEYLSS